MVLVGCRGGGFVVYLEGGSCEEGEQEEGMNELKHWYMVYGTLLRETRGRCGGLSGSRVSRGHR